MPASPENCCDPVSPTEMGALIAEDVASLFALLSDPVRLRIVSMMTDGGEVCACHLELPLGKSQPTISHHLSRLHDSGIVVGERRGRWVYWKLAPRFAVAIPQLLDAAQLDLLAQN